MKGDQLSHWYFPNPALPYNTDASPTEKAAYFIAGDNVLASQRGILERRNGFVNFCADTTFTFSGSLKRFFAWRRWTGAALTLSGKFIVMYSDVSATTARVWKQQVGTDAYPSLIHTDSTSALPFDFALANNFVFFGNGTDMKKFDGATVTNWGITGPSAAITYTSGAGSLSPTIGYSWVITFGNSSTGHMSSPSAVSTTTTGTSRQFTISGNTTTDTQVDRVHIFRTIDGGSIYFEHPSSPITYAVWAASGFVDNSADSTLTTQVAPLPNQNNRPTASFEPVWFANRMWTHANDTLYYSDYEELVRGVEEEAFSTVNQRSFGSEIVGKRVAGSYLLIYTGDNIFRIYGDSIATFRMDTLAAGKGAQNSAAICSFDELVAWLDTSNTVWITDGSTLEEISRPIRPDIAAIDHTNAALSFYRNGTSKWLILMDGGAGKLRVFDIDTKMWMPPWSVASIGAIGTCVTAIGTPKLFLGKSNKPLTYGTGYQDDGSSYTASVTTNLFDLVPQDSPAEYGVVDHLAVESDVTTVTSAQFLTDEDPDYGTFQTAGTVINPPQRTQGTYLVEKWYPIISDPNNRGARRMSLKLNWAAATTSFSVYGIDIAYKVVNRG